MTKKRFRPSRLKWAIGGLVVVGLAAVVVWATWPTPPPVGTELGQTAPDFALPDLQGREVALSDFRGQVVLLSFWQSTCPACDRALPEIRALRDRYHRRGVVWVGVNLDHDSAAAQRYLEEQGFTDQITLWGSLDAAIRVVVLLDVPLVPHTFVIDRRGVIRFSGTYPTLPRPEDIERWL